MVPLLILALAMVGGTVLRFWHLTGESLWLDELFSVWLVGQPWPEIWRYVGLENHPPLYYLLLKGWLSVFASGGEPATLDYAARSFSAICSSLLIPLAGVTAWKLGGRNCGALAALTFAVMPPLVRYGQEARMYAPLALFCGLALSGVLLYCSEPRRRYLALYVLGLVLALYTHYYTVFIWLGLTIACWTFRVWHQSSLGPPAVSPAEEPPTRNRRFLPPNILIGLMFLPWLPMLIQQWQVNSQTHWLLSQRKPEVFALFDFFGWCFGFMVRSQWVAFDEGLWTAVFVMSIPVSLLAFTNNRDTDTSQSPAQRPQNLEAFLFLSALIPPLITVGISQYKNVWQLKYLLGVVPIVGGLVVGWLWRTRTKPAAFALVGAVVLGAALSASIRDAGTMRPWNQEEWRETAAFLRVELRPGDVVLIPEPITLPPYWIALEHYGVARNDLLGIREDMGRPEDVAILERARGATGRLFFVTRFNHEGQVRSSLLEDSSWREGRSQSFRALDITLYERASASERKQP